MGNDASRTCFFITPIGGAGSPQRIRSDTVLEHILKPALVPGLVARVNRIDHDPESRSITSQIVEQIAQADLIVADITGLNANVFYEIGIAHAARKRLITIRQPSEESPPFDIAGLRVIDCPLDIAGGRRAESTIREAAEKLLEPGNNVESPVTQALLQFSASASGDDVADYTLRTLVALQAEVRALAQDVRSDAMPKRLPEWMKSTHPGALRLRSLLEQLTGEVLEARELAVAKYGEESDEVARLGTIGLRLAGHRENLSLGLLTDEGLNSLYNELKHSRAGLRSDDG